MWVKPCFNYHSGFLLTIKLRFSVYLYNQIGDLKVDKNKLSDEARIATKTFILADWRYAAIVDVEKAFENLADAYEDNAVASEKIENLYDEFKTMVNGRKEKLSEISKEAKDRAARATALLTENA